VNPVPFRIRDFFDAVDGRARAIVRAARFS